MYSGVISLTVTKNENINNNVAILSIRYITDVPIELIAIFLNFSGSLRSGGIKYKYAIPPNDAILTSPATNVL